LVNAVLPSFARLKWMWQLEGHREALRLGDLLQALLEHHVAVGHVERFGVAHVELVLALAPLALGGLHRHAGELEVAARRAVEALGARALQHVVVLEVPAGGLEVAEVLLRGLAEAGPEQVVLELGAGIAGVAELLRRIDLAAQDRARRDRHVVVRLLALHVAQHERGLLQPAGDAQRGEVDHHVHVAVAELPVGERVAGDRLHLHVDGEQVVAGVAAVLGDLLDEHLGVEALAHQAAVVVGEAGDHGLDFALRHHALQLLERQHASCVIHRSSF
jgi:hypothetical protein